MLTIRALLARYAGFLSTVRLWIVNPATHREDMLELLEHEEQWVEEAKDTIDAIEEN